jgi:hypothetical protein
MVKKFTIFFISLGFMLMDTQSGWSQDIYFRGFYHGINVFIRNPYIDSEEKFCIESIYLNGKKVIESPGTSACEISMDHLVLDSRVVIRVTHKKSCEPQIINPEVIQEDLKFSWLKVYVNEESISWVTTKEDKSAKYYIERESLGDWEVLDTVATKGGIFVNHHTIEIAHNKGKNFYRVVYKDNSGLNASEVFEFFSDKREISHVIDTERWMIEFTEEVSYQLLNNNGGVIARGKAVSCNIRKLPDATYIIRYEGNEYSFEKE